MSKQNTFDLIVTTSASNMTFSRENSDKSFKLAIDLLLKKSKQLIVIRDDPKGIANVDKCLAVEGNAQAGLCDSTREAALHRKDRLADIASTVSGVDVLDLTSLYCDADTCHSWINGVNVYSNSSHISKDFSATLQPHIEAEISDRLKR